MGTGQIYISILSVRFTDLAFLNCPYWIPFPFFFHTNSEDVLEEPDPNLFLFRGTIVV